MQVSSSGLDLAKSVFQVHGVDAAGRVVITKALRRAQVLAFFAKLPPCPRAKRHCALRPSITAQSNEALQELVWVILPDFRVAATCR